MHLFYQPDLQNGIHQLSEDETRHATRVLRLSVGDLIDVTDGKGVWAQARISDIKKRHCDFEVVDLNKQPRPPLPKVAIAPTKNMDRFEWFLEKAVELGVDEICPILCSNSERRVLKTQRCEKVLLAAMKQSQRSWLPTLHSLTPFHQFVEKASSHHLLIAHCKEARKTQLSTNINTNAWLLIGPEGDFTNEEIALVLKNKGTALDLGPSRLRTETAGIHALSIMNFLKTV